VQAYRVFGRCGNLFDDACLQISEIYLAVQAEHCTLTYNKRHNN